MRALGEGELYGTVVTRERLRELPTTRGRVTGTANEAASVVVIGRTRTSNWLKIENADGTVGWVSASAVSVDGARNVLRVLRR